VTCSVFIEAYDVVGCFHCGVFLGGWQTDHDPWVRHACRSSGCGYIKQIKGQQYILTQMERLHQEQDPEIHQVSLN